MAKGFSCTLRWFLCVLQLIALAQSQYFGVCPREDIAPCTCDPEAMNCNSATELKHVEKAFRPTFTYNAIRKLFLQGTPLKELSTGIFQSVKIQEVYLDFNQLTTFDLNLLNHSTDFTRIISLYSNAIASFSFEDLKSFKKLESLNMGKNRLVSVPADAFRGNPELKEIALDGNFIETVGENTFADLPNLRKILLASNSIQTLSSNSMNFHPEVNSLVVDLENNSVSEISKTAFGKGELKILALGRNKLEYLEEDVFADLSKKMSNRGGIIDVQRNPLTCKGCEYKWMISEKYALQWTIINFFCPDGSTLAQLTIHAIKCTQK